MIIEIFSFIKLSSLKKCMRTCEEWYNCLNRKRLFISYISKIQNFEKIWEMKFGVSNANQIKEDNFVENWKIFHMERVIFNATRKYTPPTSTAMANYNCVGINTTYHPCFLATRFKTVSDLECLIISRNIPEILNENVRCYFWQGFVRLLCCDNASSEECAFYLKKYPKLLSWVVSNLTSDESKELISKLPDLFQDECELIKYSFYGTIAWNLYVENHLVDEENLELIIVETGNKVSLRMGVCIAEKQNVSEEFFRKHYTTGKWNDTACWTAILKRNDLSEQFINEFCNRKEETLQDKIRKMIEKFEK